LKQEINPIMIAGAVVVVLLLIVVIAWKNLGNSGSGPNPYAASNAPKGMKPGGSGGPSYIGAPGGGPNGMQGGSPNSGGAMPPSSGGQ